MELKKIKNFNNYLITDEGKIFDIERDKFIKPFRKKAGYYAINLKNDDGKYEQPHLHRLLYQAFIGDLRENMAVIFRDNNKANYKLSNLLQITFRDVIFLIHFRNEMLNRMEEEINNMLYIMGDN